MQCREDSQWGRAGQEEGSGAGQARAGQGRAGQRPVDKCHIQPPARQGRAGACKAVQCQAFRVSQPLLHPKSSLMAPAVLEGKSATTGWLSEWQFGLHATPLGGGAVCPSGPTE